MSNTPLTPDIHISDRHPFLKVCSCCAKEDGTIKSISFGWGQLDVNPPQSGATVVALCLDCRKAAAKVLLNGLPGYQSDVGFFHGVW